LRWGFKGKEIFRNEKRKEPEVKRNFRVFHLLWWREKVQDAPMSAGCAEMRKPRKIESFINFGETGDEPNTFYF